MLSVARRIALLMLMLTLPFNGWALAAAQACTTADMQAAGVDSKHPCCAEHQAGAGQKACAEHATAKPEKPTSASACHDGAACQCSSAVSIASQPLIVSAETAPLVLRVDVPVAMVHSDSAPPFRPPIQS